jgi:O-antigen/teichoic acid export membrane protein
VRAELVKSSISGIVQFCVGLLLVLIAIPVFVKTLGTEAYGLFSLIALVGSLNVFVNLGLNSALVRFLAEQGKTAESDMDIVVTLAILMVILVPMMLLAVLFRNEILLNLLNVPMHLLEDAQWLFFSMLVGSAMILAGQTFTAILDSQQKVYLTNLLQMVYNIIYWGSILTVVLLAHSLKAVAVATLMATAIWFLSVLITALRLWGKFSLDGLSRHGTRIVRKQLSYGLQIYAAGLINVLYEPLTKILVSHLIGIAEVGIYDIGLRVKNQIYGFVSKVLYPIFPLISKLTGKEKIRKIVHDVEQKTFFVALPLTAVILLDVKPLVALFFHSRIVEISITIAFIVSGYLIGSSTVVPIYDFLLVKGHASKTILIQFVNAFANGLAILLLFPSLGYYSVVAGNTTAIVASFSLLIYFQYKYFKSLVFDSIKQALAVVLSFVAALAFGYATNLIVGFGPWNLITGPTAAILVTAYLYRLLGLVKMEDVVRYFGQSNWLSKLIVRVFCGEWRQGLAET